MLSGTIFDIKRYAIHDGPGIRTTVFFKGCPLRCVWCHNPEGLECRPQPSVRIQRCVGCGRCVKVCSQGAIEIKDGKSVTQPSLCSRCGQCLDPCLMGAREITGYTISVPRLMVELEKDVIFYDQSGGGVTFSGGEALMQPDFLCALAQQCQSRDIHTVVDTTCYTQPETLHRVAQHTNLFLCDVKHMDAGQHEKYTGVSNGLILDNIRLLSQWGKEIVLRLPLIPGINDDLDNVDRTIGFAASLETVQCIDVLPYNRGGLGKVERLCNGIRIIDFGMQDETLMTAVVERIKAAGFDVQVGG